MKKRVLVTSCMLLLAGGLLAGCGGNKQEELTDSQTVAESGSEISTEEISAGENADADAGQAESKEGMARSIFTGQWVDETIATKRPIAVMIENTKAALPQYGITKADIYYECPVEGGITRMMAIFQDYSGIEQIGNVRSCRPYYAYYAAEYNAIYFHAGGSVEGKEALKSGVVDEVDGISDTAFFRDDSKKAPHNLYISSDAIDETIAKKSFAATIDLTTMPEHYHFASDDAQVTLDNGVAATIASVYYPNNKPWFEYNPQDGLYYRYEFKNPQVDAINNQQLSVKNILVQYVKSSYYDKEKGTLNLEWSGSGEGYYITNGKAIDITWTRNGQDDVTRYYDMDGNEIVLNQGKTWISVVQSSQKDKTKFHNTKEEFENDK